MAKNRSILHSVWFKLFAGFYLGFGLLIGGAMRYFVPATNWRGVGYIAVVWPAMITSRWTGDYPHVPAWCFTFDEKELV